MKKRIIKYISKLGGVGKTTELVDQAIRRKAKVSPGAIIYIACYGQKQVERVRTELLRRGQDLEGFYICDETKKKKLMGNGGAHN